MSLSPAFLDELRARTPLSTLIGRTVKVTKAGREHKACCPFHGEKTPSFTINDEKGFYHCFGCGAHGDAIRWLTDSQGLPFLDAVRELADAAGLEMPARSPDDARREAALESGAAVLERAAVWYAGQLAKDDKARDLLTTRGVAAGAIDRFGLGWAPIKGGVAGCGVPVDQLTGAGLLIEGRNGFTDRFRARLIIPIHDARGRVVGFGGRATREDQQAKYLNSESGLFDKGRTLFNLHRAAPAAREARRLILVEGYFDVIALDAIGISEVVAPMGTAITEAQLERAWRVHHCPVLLMDGDKAGMAAAHKAAVRALPMAAPGRSLAFAALPEGMDPDDLARSGGIDAVEAVLHEPVSLVAMIWDGALAQADTASPEGRAGLTKRLAELAGTIRDPETRAEYDAEFRTRLAARFPPPPPWAVDFDILPSGTLEAFDALGAREQARLRAVAADWLDDRIEKAPKGRKKSDGVALLKIAFSVGRRIGAGLIDEAPAKERLWPLYEGIEGIDHALVDRAIADGLRKPWDIGPDLITMQCATLPMTDFGLAERFILRNGADYFFTTAKGWLGWDERRWNVMDQEKDGPPPARLQGAIFDTVRAIQDEARFMRRTGLQNEDGNPHGMDRWIPKGKTGELLSAIISRFGRQCETAGKPSAIATLARKWLTVPIEAFDCDPLAINVMNGTLRFTRTKGADGHRRARVELEAHQRKHMNTRLAPVTYDETAESAAYDKFLAWAQPDAAMRRYLHQWAGYSASGDVSEQKLHFWYGLGANGKSTAIDLWAKVLGDYSGTIGIETFLDQGIKKRGEQASPDLARLGGVRLLRASEPERGAKLNEALIKAATGGEPMAVRALHRGFFDLMPLFKLTIGGNYKPNVPGTDEGIWRRLKLIPWNSHVADADRDETLPARLWDEAAGVLNHMVRGLLDWLENGLVEPDAVRDATAQYREESDPLARFLKDCTIAEADGRIQSSLLHEVFVAWAKAAGEKEWSNKGLALAMSDKGIPKITSNGVHWMGLKLVRGSSDFVDDQGRVKRLRDDGESDIPPPHPDDPGPDDYEVPPFR